MTALLAPRNEPNLILILTVTVLITATAAPTLTLILIPTLSPTLTRTQSSTSPCVELSGLRSGSWSLSWLGIRQDYGLTLTLTLTHG